MPSLRAPAGGHGTPDRPEHDVYSPGEIADATGVPRWLVDFTADDHSLPRLPGGFLHWNDAVLLGQLVTRQRPGLFAPPREGERDPALPATVSAGIHAAVLAVAVLVTSAGLGSAPNQVPDDVRDPMRLVYLVTPGTGGGGGGGGARQKLPPPRAMRQGSMSISSPLPDRKPPESIEPAPPKPEPPPPPKAAEPVQAPVATVAADPRDRAGVPEQTPSADESRGPGVGGGVVSGAGTGIGEGAGSGLGEGEGGGTGGGPYRPGSGIEPPRLLREVKPDYSDEARRAGISGEVVMEIVVRRDGAVGDVRVLQGLGHGLDARAIEAVKQWRFAPARRKNAPVDVLVEVAVEFRVR